MGTRHFVGVIYKNEYKIAQYGQWDGYISGQGSVVLEFLKTADLTVFKEKLANCRFVSNDEVRKMYVMAGDDPDNNTGFITAQIAENFNAMFPSMSRDTGAGVLHIAYESVGEVPLYDRRDFLNDDVWCEFAYVINLDDNTLRCYVE